MTTSSMLLDAARRLENQYEAEFQRLRTIPQSDWKPLWQAEMRAKTARDVRLAIEEAITSESNREEGNDNADNNNPA